MKYIPEDYHEQVQLPPYIKFNGEIMCPVNIWKTKNKHVQIIHIKVTLNFTKLSVSGIVQITRDLENERK